MRLSSTPVLQSGCSLDKLVTRGKSLRLFAMLSAAAAMVLVCWSTAYGEQGAIKTGNSVQPPVPAVPTLTQKDLTDVAARLGTVESGISKLAERVSKTDYTPAVLGLAGSFFGVLVGGIITVLTQRWLLAHQRSLADSAAERARELADAKAKQDLDLADKRARLEIGNAFAQWQLKQLSELYGPLHALLRQSNVMYRHMNAVLVTADSERFRLRQGEANDDFDSKVFEINVDGQWVCFRTVIHIGEVYGKTYGIEDYFDEVVAIGGRIASVISENAGYARPEQPELISVFGKYLAHYSVLGRLHSQTKDRTRVSAQRGTSGTQRDEPSARVIAVDESAAFPKEIRGLVDVGFDAINAELNTWRTRAAS